MHERSSEMEHFSECELFFYFFDKGALALVEFQVRESLVARRMTKSSLTSSTGRSCRNIKNIVAQNRHFTTRVPWRYSPTHLDRIHHFLTPSDREHVV